MSILVKNYWMMCQPEFARAVSVFCDSSPDIPPFSSPMCYLFLHWFYISHSSALPTSTCDYIHITIIPACIVEGKNGKAAVDQTLSWDMGIGEQTPPSGVQSFVGCLCGPYLSWLSARVMPQSLAVLMSYCFPSRVFPVLPLYLSHISHCDDQQG